MGESPSSGSWVPQQPQTSASWTPSESPSLGSLVLHQSQASASWTPLESPASGSWTPQESQAWNMQESRNPQESWKPPEQPAVQDAAPTASSHPAAFLAMAFNRQRGGSSQSASLVPAAFKTSSFQNMRSK